VIIVVIREEKEVENIKEGKVAVEDVVAVVVEVEIRKNLPNIRR